MRVAAYIRVSTDEQAEKGNSLIEQRERLIAYCTAMGWEQPIFFEDDGYSAKDLKRPAAKKMISEVQKNKFDIVLTSKLDRMSRKLLDMLQLVKLFNDHECGFVSSSEGFDTSTAVGRMVLQLLATFAEFERERTSERVKDNMTSLAKNTDIALGKSCYGFDVIDRKYVINEAEEEVIECMAQAAEDGNGYRMIAKILNDNGYITREGNAWDQISVKRVIRNVMLSGTRIFNARKNKDGKMVARDKDEWIIRDDNHPAILDKDRHERILALLDSRKPARKHADNETYLLTGILTCGHCGRNMKGNTARVRRANASYDYYRYVCASYTLGYGCKYHAVHRNDMETKIIEYIKELIDNSTNDLELVIAPSTKGRDEIKELQSQLDKIDRRIQKQIEAYSNDLISANDLKTASDKANKERSAINEQLEKASKRKSGVRELKDAARALLGDIMGDDRIKSKSAVRQLLDKITITDGTDIRVVWRSLV